MIKDHPLLGQEVVSGSGEQFVVSGVKAGCMLLDTTSKIGAATFKSTIRLRLEPKVGAGRASWTTPMLYEPRKSDEARANDR